MHPSYQGSEYYLNKINYQNTYQQVMIESDLQREAYFLGTTAFLKMF